MSHSRVKDMTTHATMAEVLGIASGIAGLLSLTIEVFGISYKYVNEVSRCVIFCTPISQGVGSVAESPS